MFEYNKLNMGKQMKSTYLPPKKLAIHFIIVYIIPVDVDIVSLMHISFAAKFSLLLIIIIILIFNLI